MVWYETHMQMKSKEVYQTDSNGLKLGSENAFSWIIFGL